MDLSFLSNFMIQEIYLQWYLFTLLIALGIVNNLLTTENIAALRRATLRHAILPILAGAALKGSSIKKMVHEIKSKSKFKKNKIMNKIKMLVG